MKMACFLLMSAVAAGCVSGPSRGYIDPNDDVFGRASHMEYPQMHLALVNVLAKMRTDPMFTTQYDAAKVRAAEAKRALPTIAVKHIENNTGDNRGDSATGQITRELITELRKTRLFEIIEYSRGAEMTKDVISAVDHGEGSANLQNIGSYTSADFTMTGELRCEFTDDRDRRVYHHFLNLEMTDTKTRTVCWSDTADPTVKFRAK